MMAIPKWLCRKCGNPVYTFKLEKTEFCEFYQPNQAGEPYWFKDSSRKATEIREGYVCFECNEPSKNLGMIAEWKVEK